MLPYRRKTHIDLDQGAARRADLAASTLYLSVADKAELARQMQSKVCDFCATANVRFGSIADIHTILFHCLIISCSNCDDFGRRRPLDT